MITKKRWGTTETLFKNDDAELCQLDIDAGGYCSRHYHVDKLNTFFVEHGNLSLTTYDQSGVPRSKQVLTRDSGPFEINPGVFHRFVALTDCRVQEFYRRSSCKPVDESDIMRADLGGRFATNLGSTRLHRIYVGFDSSQEIAYEVLNYSLRRHITTNIEIIPLILPQIEHELGYVRPTDPAQSTEFTYLRFLVPLIANYKGLALFMDSDMLCLADPYELFTLPMDNLAIRCVQHNYAPAKEARKMGGKVQSSYPRKNWSSVMLMNCARLGLWTKEFVETQPGSVLHRFEGIPDNLIGSLPPEWNSLDTYVAGVTKLLHYTSGGPWLPGCEAHPHAGIWQTWRDNYLMDTKC